MPVTLTNPEAQIAAAAIEGYLEQHRINVRHHAAMSAILGSDAEVRPLNSDTIAGLEYVLALLNGSSRDDAMGRLELAPVARALTATRATPARTRMDLGGDAAVLRLIMHAGDTATTERLAGELDVPEPFMELWLHDLQADELVRALQNGHGTVTWELTALGDGTL